MVGDAIRCTRILGTVLIGIVRAFASDFREGNARQLFAATSTGNAHIRAASNDFRLCGQFAPIGGAAFLKKGGLERIRSTNGSVILVTAIFVRMAGSHC